MEADVNASGRQWSTPVAILTGVITSALLEATWLLVWILVMQLVSFVTYSPYRAGSRGLVETGLSVIYLPGAIIPTVYLPFLARGIIARLTNDRRAGWLGYAVSFVIAVGLSVWVSWLETQGYRP